MKGTRSKAAAGGMDIDFSDALYNDGIDLGDPDVPMMEGDPTEKVWGEEREGRGDAGRGDAGRGDAAGAGWCGVICA